MLIKRVSKGSNPFILKKGMARGEAPYSSKGGGWE